MGRWVEGVSACLKAALDFRNRFVGRHNWSVKTCNRCVGCQRQVCEEVALQRGEVRNKEVSRMRGNPVQCGGKVGSGEGSWAHEQAPGGGGGAGAWPTHWVLGRVPESCSGVSSAASPLPCSDTLPPGRGT